MWIQGGTQHIYARETEKARIRCLVLCTNYKNDQDSIITAKEWQLSHCSTA